MSDGSIERWRSLVNLSTLWTRVLVPTVVAVVLLAHVVTAGQTEPEEVTLQPTANHITMTDAHTRCGEYFVLETHTYGDVAVKQVHVVMPLSATNVALIGLYYKSVHTILDESAEAPVLIRKKGPAGRETDELRLKRSVFEQSKACLPPPEEN